MDQNLETTCFENCISDFEIGLLLLLYQVSRNPDRNSQNKAEMASGVFLLIQVSKIDFMHEKCIKAI